LSYQWSLNGTALVGATNSALTLNTVQPADAGSYTVGVTNFAGSVTSAVATLIVNAPPLITTEPQSQTVTVGQSVSFSVVASGTEPLSYQWSLNGTALVGATNSALTLNTVQPADAGSYTVGVTNFAGSVTSAVATLIVGVLPLITTEPQSQTVTVGYPALFSVVASGTEPLSYQWNLNGTALVSATNSALALNTVRPADAGSYTVVVTNFAGSVTSAVATLIVNVPPLIISEPQSETVTVGQSASFSVVASGTEPLSYQWSLNGTALPGATNSALTLNTVQPSDAGSYTVVVTNSVSSVTSAVATLIVNVPPLITTEPQSQTVTVGHPALFSVVASGTEPLSYQWNLNGTALASATNSALTLNTAQPSDAGSYTVVVTNSVSSVTSAVATLTVTNPPCTTPPRFGSAGMTANGFTFQLSASIGCNYVIIASTNLMDWTPISTNVALAGTLEFTDSTATNLSVRFYRTMAQ
jgi:hypothetical protein